MTLTGKPDFHIVLISSAAHSHIKCFTEVIILLKKSIEDCGYNCTFAHNTLSKNAYNIIIGAHFLKPQAIPDDIKIITFQFEQLSATNGIFNSNLEKVLRRSEYVWDYSIDNINFLQKRGIKAQYVPLGYHSILEQIDTNIPKDIDLLFYGSINDRRRSILQKIHLDTGIKTLTLFDVYGKERNQYIARSKIVLNIHFFESQIFESVRISFLLNNKIPIIVENSEVNPYNKVDIAIYKKEDLSNQISNILNNYDQFIDKTVSNYNDFKMNYLMTDIIKKTIKDY